MLSVKLIQSEIIAFPLGLELWGGIFPAQDINFYEWKLNKYYFWENKGDLILQLKHWRHIVWLLLKNKVLVVAYYVRSTEQ